MYISVGQLLCSARILHVCMYVCLLRVQRCNKLFYILQCGARPHPLEGWQIYVCECLTE